MSEGEVEGWLSFIEDVLNKDSSMNSDMGLSVQSNYVGQLLSQLGGQLPSPLVQQPVQQVQQDKRVPEGYQPSPEVIAYMKTNWKQMGLTSDPFEEIIETRVLSNEAKSWMDHRINQSGVQISSPLVHWSTSSTGTTRQ